MSGKDFYQSPGNLHVDLFEHDRSLQLELKRRLSPLRAAVLMPRVAAVGAATADPLPSLAVAAEQEPPTHVPYDAWGRRVDVIRTSSAWQRIHDVAAELGIVAAGYGDGADARVAQAAMIYLFAASSSMVSCPLAMTDAAARVLTDKARPALRARLLPRLLSTDPATFITSGQWMTERTGGSDVADTSTTATKDGDQYQLHGVKWFTSATTSAMALTLARVVDDHGVGVAGSRGLSLFCVELERDEHGALPNIMVNRLKDKLGTKALPTAELTLQGVRATLIGEVGRGVAEIATMLNITRLHNSLSAASYMRKAVTMAQQYAWQRQAFGRPIAAQPLHARTLSELDAVTAAALLLSMECASLLGRVEHKVASDDDAMVLRALLPITKLLTAKQAMATVSEALECFGGAGYVEDVGVARLLRDVQVLSIWEGTTNVLSLDVLRAEKRDGAMTHLLNHLQRRCESLGGDAVISAVVTPRLHRLAAHVASLSLDDVESEARTVAMAIGRIMQAILLAEAAAVGSKDARARLDHFCTATWPSH